MNWNTEEESAKFFEDALKECKEKARSGATTEEIIAHLHHKGLDILDSTKVVMQVFGVSLGESKQLVTGHSVWASTVRETDALHQELEEVLREDQETDGRSIR